MIEVEANEPDIYRDHRGIFLESFRGRRRFVQGNVSVSRANVLRGCHWQCHKPQGKQITCVAGSILDVIVDLRFGSSSFGTWKSFHLSADNRYSLYVPKGFAHGFLAGPDGATVVYECTSLYNKLWARTLRWDDPTVGIDWGLGDRVPVLSDKDANAPFIEDLDESDMP